MVHQAYVNSLHTNSPHATAFDLAGGDTQYSCRIIGPQERGKVWALGARVWDLIMKVQEPWGKPYIDRVATSFPVVLST